MRKRLMQICTLVIVSLLVLMVAGNVMAAQTDPMAGMNMATPTPAASDPNSLDLQISGSSTGTSSQNMMMDMMEMANMMDQQKTAMDSMMNMMHMDGMMMNQEMSMEMNKMNQMMSMEMGMMGMGNMGMGSMSGSNSGTMGGAGGLDPNILAQIQATNTLLTQMLNLLLTQTKDTNSQPQLQIIQQMLVNQATLLQLLVNGSMNMGSGSGSMNMAPTGNSGSMNMGGNSGGMMMM